MKELGCGCTLKVSEEWPKTGGRKSSYFETLKRSEITVFPEFQKFLFCETLHQGNCRNLAMKLSASGGLTAAETKECADKLLKTTKSTATPATGLLQFQRDGFTSLC